MLRRQYHASVKFTDELQRESDRHNARLLILNMERDEQRNIKRRLLEGGYSLEE